MNIYNRKSPDTPVMIMMVGLPASGKSTYAKSLAISRADKKYIPKIHSSDDLREEFFGSEATQGDNSVLFAELHKRIKADLIAGNDIVYDATNIKKKLRKQFLSELKNIPCTPICICMMTSYKTCLENNEKRDRQVPKEVIKRMWTNWQPPHYNEGFKEIKYVFSSLDDKFANNFTVPAFFEKANAFDQENKHHALTLGEHCEKAATYIQEHNTDNYNLLIATMLHDVGKLYTKTRLNSKGVDDGNCHFYNHHCLGSYEAAFYLHYAKQFTEEDITYITNLIYYHMHPYLQWKQSQKCLNRDKDMFGENMMSDIMMLHNADLFAH